MGLISQHRSIQCGTDCRMIASICNSNALMLDDKEGVSELHHPIWHVCVNLAGLRLILAKIISKHFCAMSMQSSLL